MYLADRRHADIAIGFNRKGKLCNAQSIVRLLARMANLQSVDVEVLSPEYGDRREGFNTQFRAGILECLAQIAILPSRPAIDTLSIVGNSVDDIYAICSPLAPLCIRKLTILTELTDDDATDVAYLPSVAASQTRPLQMALNELDLSEAPGTLPALCARVANSQEIQRLSLPGALSELCHRALKDMAPKTHSLFWKPTQPLPAGIGTSWASLRCLQTDCSPQGLQLVAAAYASPRELDIGLATPDQELDSLRRLSTYIRSCGQLRSLRLFCAFTNADVDQCEVVLCMQELKTACAERHVKLGMQVQSWHQQSLTTCQPMLEAATPHLDALSLDFKDNLTASLVQSDLDKHSILQHDALKPLLLNNLTHLSLSMPNTSSSIGSHNRLAAAVLAFLRFHHMPALVRLDLVIASEETAYVAEIAELIESHALPSLEKFEATFELLSPDSSRTWEEGAEADARYALWKAMHKMVISSHLRWIPALRNI